MKEISDVTGGGVHFVNTHNGKDVILLGSHGNGTLSSRYIVEIAGQRYFMKTFAPSDSCPVASSRRVIENEIAVEEYLSRYATLQRSFYRGFTEVADHLCLLFEDMILGRNAQTLAEKIAVRDDFSLDYRTEEEWQRGVVAQNRLPVHEAVFIAQGLASYASLFHTLDDSAEGGVIHTDVTPSNVMVYNSVEEGVVRQGAMLLDFGIARRKNKPMNVLFNKVRVEGVQGTYYSSFEIPLHNRVYAPHAADYTVAEPSFDTYQISNLLCLMVTGRLMQHWQHKAAVAEGEDASSGSELEKILDRVVHTSPLTEDGVSLSDKKSDKKKRTTIYNSLLQILLRGTHPEKEKRYQAAEELAADLKKLGLPAPKSYSASRRLLPFQDVPPEIASYGTIVIPTMKPSLHTLSVDKLVDVSYASLEQELQLGNEGIQKVLGSNQFGDVSTLAAVVEAERAQGVLEKARKSRFWTSVRRVLFGGIVFGGLAVGAYFGYPYALRFLDAKPEVRKFQVSEGGAGIISIAVSDSGVNDGLEDIIFYEDDTSKIIFGWSIRGSSSFIKTILPNREMCGHDYRLKVRDIGGHEVLSDRLRVIYDECNK